MIDANLVLPPKARVLALGAHPDDIEIGAGGTLLRLFAARPDLRLTWVVFSGNQRRRREAKRSATMFTRPLRRPEIHCLGFRDGFFPTQTASIKRRFEGFAARSLPDLIFTHRGEDRHQDHRVISELTWNTFRDAVILEYEIPKYDGDLGQPNLYGILDEATLAAKVDLLLRGFPSQRTKRWFTPDTFRALARIRGIETGNGPFAEGFGVRKLTLSWSEPRPTADRKTSGPRRRGRANQ